jgi:hypothetical protein
MIRIKYSAVLAAAIVMACASASTGAKSGTTAHATNVISRDEIMAAQVYSAYDAIQRLRPSFFRSHGSTTMAANDAGLPSVYLNRQLYGDIGSLKQIEVAAIREIHYYTPAEASTRFGKGNPSGAIEVVTDAQ